jgi:hypothetical protein
LIDLVEEREDAGIWESVVAIELDNDRLVFDLAKSVIGVSGPAVAVSPLDEIDVVTRILSAPLIDEFWCAVTRVIVDHQVAEAALRIPLDVDRVETRQDVSAGVALGGDDVKVMLVPLPDQRIAKDFPAPPGRPKKEANPVTAQKPRQAFAGIPHALRQSYSDERQTCDL